MPSPRPRRRSLRRPHPADPPPTTILSLPPDLFSRILYLALLPPTATYLTPADLSSPTFQSLSRTSPATRTALLASITHFSFFGIANTRTPPSALLPTILAAPHLRHLQLFLRPRDVASAAAVAAALPHHTLTTLHLSCAPSPPRAPLPAVAHVLASLPPLAALSLDCCGTLSTATSTALARALAPTLTRLALDSTSLDSWPDIALFPHLTELRLQNTHSLSSPALATILSSLPHLSSLELHQVALITASALTPLHSSPLQRITLSRCRGLSSDAVTLLASAPALTHIALCSIDVNASALASVARALGPRLRSLAVNSVTSAGGGSGDVADLLATVEAHCGDAGVDFSAGARPQKHWSARPFEEALRRPVHAHAAERRVKRTGWAAGRIIVAGWRRRPLGSCF